MVVALWPIWPMGEIVTHHWNCYGDDKFYGLPNSGLSFLYQWDWYKFKLHIDAFPQNHVDVDFRRGNIGGSGLL